MTSPRAFLKQWSTGNLSWLYLSRLLQNMGANFLSIFGPIFVLIQFSEQIEWYLSFFLVIHIASFTMAPFVMPHIINGSLKRRIYVAVPLIIMYYMAINLIPYNPLWVGAASVVTLVLFRYFFWVPYNIQVAEFSETINRGKQVNLLFVAMAIIGIFLPILSGFVVDRWGFVWLYVVAALLWILSIFPLSKVADLAEFFTWKPSETWRYFFHARNRRQVVTYMSEGINDAGQLFIWPLAIWLLLDKQYVNMGLLIGAVVFATAIVRLFLAQRMDKHSKKKVLLLGTWLTGIAWLARIIIYSPLQIFVVDSFYRLSSSTLKSSFDTIMYGEAAESDNYVDEYTIIREMAINFGRSTMFVIAILSYILLPTFWIAITFVYISLSTFFLRWQADGHS